MIGSTIGRYRIDAELGRGGMGIVYRATQLTLDRRVAIKMLPKHMASSEEYLARFRREAETLARVAHEDIVHIYDIEEHEGDHFIIMEFVSGPSLTKLMADEGRIHPARARDVTAIMTNALAVAHRQGIVHRDLKPDNILFSAAGRPKLTDFGIAHMRDDSKYKTRTGIMLGTPYYLSPEQALGKPVTGASDLYSLGVVLYEMLCGAVPFDGQDALSVAIKHIREKAPPLADRAPDLPAGLCAVVHQALEKEPGDRFSSASELHARLVELDLGRSPGMALHLEVPAHAGEVRREHDCPECGAGLRAGFVRCPNCGAATRKKCTRCGNRYDPVAPQCPICKTPAPGAAVAPSAARASPSAGISDRLGGAAREGAGLVVEGAQVAGEALSGLAGAARRAAPSRTVIGQAIDLSKKRAAGLPVVLWAGMVLVLSGVGLAVAIAVAGGGDEPATEIVEASLPLGPGDGAGGRPFVSSSPGRGPSSPATGTGAASAVAGSEFSLSPATQTARAEVGGSNPPPIFLRILASAGAAWRVEEDARWAVARPAAGSGDATIEIRVDISGMTAGSYRATVTVRAADGSTRQQASVRLVLSTPGTSVGPADEPTPTGSAPEAESAAGARAEIGRLLARYERATETGDFGLLEPVVSSAVARKWRAGFQRLHREASNVSIILSDTRIDVVDPDRAEVEFHARIEGSVEGDVERFFDGRVEWDVNRVGGRWTIASVSR